MENFNFDEISDFSQFSSNIPNITSLMNEGKEVLYTVTSDITKENKKFKCYERTIQLQSKNHGL